MAFSEALAARIRRRFMNRAGAVEKKMFGGVGFLLNGNLRVGVHKESLIVRLDPEEAEAALREPHVGEFAVGGRPMKGWLLVAPEGAAHDDALNGWIQRAVKFVAGLPAK
jgi:hypothetical protein